MVIKINSIKFIVHILRLKDNADRSSHCGSKNTRHYNF